MDRKREIVEIIDEHQTWDFSTLERKRLLRLENSTKAMALANAALRDYIGPVTERERAEIEKRLRALRPAGEEESLPLPPPPSRSPVASRTALLKRVRAIVVTCPDKASILTALDEMLDSMGRDGK